MLAIVFHVEVCRILTVFCVIFNGKVMKLLYANTLEKHGNQIMLYENIYKVCAHDEI